MEDAFGKGQGFETLWMSNGPNKVIIAVIGKGVFQPRQSRIGRKPLQSGHCLPGKMYSAKNSSTAASYNSLF